MKNINQQAGLSSMADAMPGVALTPCQASAVMALDRFLADPVAGVFILKGYAGTGKTTLIKGVAAALSAAGRPFQLLAPTGRAARVIRQRTGFEANTIHRLIYRLDTVQAGTGSGDKHTEMARFVFQLAANNGAAGTVYVVDEASMLSDTFQASEHLQFGSGKLLSDFLEYTRPCSRAFHAKVVFVGDPAQLPPVGSSFSPALDAGYLRRISGVDVAEVELADVVRQEAGMILENASALRNGLRGGIYGGLDVRAGADVFEVGVDSIIKTYLGDRREPDPETVIIAQSNERVRDYNRMIRATLFPRGDILERGDRLLVVANSYCMGEPIYNGDMAEVLAVDALPQSPAKPVFVNAGRDEHGAVKHVFVPLKFRKVRLRLCAGGEGGREIETLVLENLPGSPEADLTPLEMKGLYVDFRNRHPGLRPGTAGFKEALAGDPWYNALRVKHGYAMTCHKAQGGEWRRVIVDFRCSMNVFTPDYYRWAYTALTRAREVLFAVHPPHHAPDQPVRPYGQSLPPRPDILEIKSIQAMEYRMPGYESDDKFLRALHYAVWLRAGAGGLEVAHEMSRPWMEVIKVMNSWKEKGCVRFHYNAGHRVTKVEVDPKAPVRLRESARAALGDLAERTLVVTGGASNGKGGNDEAPLVKGPEWLQLFDQSLRVTVATAGVRLSTAEGLSAYQYRYRFEKDGHAAVLMFYFNSRGVLTTCVPVPGGTTSTGLAEQLLGLINRTGAS
jgi:hypothetical protein